MSVWLRLSDDAARLVVETLTEEMGRRKDAYRMETLALDSSAKYPEEQRKELEEHAILNSVWVKDAQLIIDMMEKQWNK